MATLLRFDNTLGALSIGFSVSTILYGVLLVQTYNYGCRYPSDKIGYKATVMLLLLLETVHQAFIGHCVYYYSVTNFLNVFALLGKLVWSLPFQLLIAAVVGSIVKFFFSLRVWRFSNGNVLLTGFLLLLNFGQLGIAFAYTVKCYGLPALPDLANIKALGVAALGIGTLNDICITVALCYYLQTMRSSYATMNSLIKRLTIYALGTGAVTSALSFSTLIIYLIMPTNFVFVGFYFVLGKLYAVSFITTLNTRQTTNTNDTKRSSLATLQRSHSSNILSRSSRVSRDSQDVAAALNTHQTANTMDPKRFSAATIQRSSSFNIPLRPSRVVSDSRDVESHAGEVPVNNVSFLLHPGAYINHDTNMHPSFV